MRIFVFHLFKAKKKNIKNFLVLYLMNSSQKNLNILIGLEKYKKNIFKVNLI